MRVVSSTRNTPAIAVAERHDRRVEDAVRARDVARRRRSGSARAPEDARRARRPVLPRDRRGSFGSGGGGHRAPSSATRWSSSTSTSSPAEVVRAAATIGSGVPLPVELRDRREQHLRVRMQRVAEHALGRAHLDDAAAAQDHGPVAEVVAEREVVRDEEDPEAARLQVAEQVQDVDPGGRVEHADDLVRDEQLDVEQERPRDEEALELAAAELVRVLVRGSRRG